jgi:hypothetical protein
VRNEEQEGEERRQTRKLDDERDLKDVLQPTRSTEIVRIALRPVDEMTSREEIRT